MLQLYATEAALARARADLAQLEDRSARARARGGERPPADGDRPPLADRIPETGRGVVARPVRPWRAGPDRRDPRCHLPRRGDGGDRRPLPGDGPQRAARGGSRAAGAAARPRSGPIWPFDERTLDGARDAARAGAERFTAAVSERRRTVSTLRRQQALTAQRLTALESRARAAERRSADLTAEAAGAVDTATASDPSPPPTTATAPAPATPAGTRTLVVDAVAYHLSGSTASGLPVGIGVIAVDPAVIPLGTRVFVPGYGPAVAADVGSAIRGNIIDLWMPSTAQAQAWGRRSVTITVYG